MRLVLFFALVIPSFTLAQPSFNMTLLSNFDLPNLPTRFGAQYNDCWGFRHANGTEVAIIGGMEDIFFVNVTNPTNPVLIYTHHVLNSPTGSNNESLWRDFKTYGNYAYASADEGTSGLLIFDLSNVPASVTMVKQTVAFWTRSHNIFIDEQNGKLYASGSNTVSNGLVILDLVSNPADPTTFWNVPLNTLGGGYVHETYVRDNIAYCSHGSLSKLQMYDFSNLPSFTLVGRVDNYPEEGYNHSSWLNSQGNMLVMADETHGSDVKLVDISQPLDVSIDDCYTFYSELLGPGAPGSSVVHNPFILGDLAYLAYYHDGVQVYDISNPNDITRVAYYDTYPDNVDYNGYEGCWGVYPFLPSGIIIASDQNYGLYVMEITNSPLDIDFISFDAFRQKSNIELEWVVADVSFGSVFEIMKSTDGGITFQPIGNVNLEEGKSKYEFTDHQVVPSFKYVYRIDFLQDDLSRVSSPLRHVRTASNGQSFRVPNPISNELIVDILVPTETLNLALYNVEGQQVWAEKITGPDSRIERQLENIPAGQYVLRLHTGVESENLIIQKTR
jgi:choice-of-anchor B domain-containing protein